MKQSILIFTILIISACSSQQSIRDNTGIQSNTTQAFVIVGSVGEENVIAVDGEQGHVEMQNKGLGPQLYLIPVRVGNTFSIRKVYMEPQPGYDFGLAPRTKLSLPK